MGINTNTLTCHLTPPPRQTGNPTDTHNYTNLKQICNKDLEDRINTKYTTLLTKTTNAIPVKTYTHEHVPPSYIVYIDT